MKNNRFWNWVRNEETGASEMYLYGAIAESTWFEDDVPLPCSARNCKNTAVM